MISLVQFSKLVAALSFLHAAEQTLAKPAIIDSKGSVWNRKNLRKDTFHGRERRKPVSFCHFQQFLMRL
jgi:hypothetical protein